MGIRGEAARAAQTILEDVSACGHALKIKSPTGQVIDMFGNSSDISQLIDPDTGMAVSGNFAHVALSLLTLQTKGIGTPKGVANASEKPWLVTFANILGQSHTFKVMQTRPDAEMGVLLCILEVYNGTC